MHLEMPVLEPSSSRTTSVLNHGDVISTQSPVTLIRPSAIPGSLPISHALCIADVLLHLCLLVAGTETTAVLCAGGRQEVDEEGEDVECEDEGDDPLNDSGFVVALHTA